MRYFRLYHSDPWYQTSDVSLKRLCREIFKTEQGCSDGYEKVWKMVYISWGDEELGGSAEVENCKLTTTKIRVEAWNRQERRVFNGEFWAWYQLYDWLSSVIWDYVPTFRYNPIHVHTVQVIADFYSFSVAFDPDDFDKEVEQFYEKLIIPAPWGATIYSDDDKYPYIEIYLDCNRYQFKTEDGKFMFYLPTIENPSQLKEFMELILSEPYDRDAKEAET